MACPVTFNWPKQISDHSDLQVWGVRLHEVIHFVLHFEVLLFTKFELLRKCNSLRIKIKPEVAYAVQSFSYDHVLRARCYD